MKVKRSERQFNPFLTPNDVEDGAVATIVGEGTIVNTQFRNEALRIPVKIGDKTYEWTLNRTSQNNLIDAFGEETANWVNKQVKINKTKMLVRGEMRSVLVAEPITEKKKVTK